MSTDTSLTAIKGVGKKTAPRLEAATGLTDPRELVRSYLTDSGEEIADVVPREDYLLQSIRDEEWSLTNSDLGVTTDPDGRFAVHAMLFIRQFGVTKSDLSNLTGVEEYPTGVAGHTVSPSNIDWTGDTRVMDPSYAIAVANSTDALPHADNGRWDGLRPIDVREHTHYRGKIEVERVEVDGGVTHVRTEHLQQLDDVLPFDTLLSENIYGHPEGERPVLLDGGMGVVGAVAPRIMPS